MFKQVEEVNYLYNSSVCPVWQQIQRLNLMYSEGGNRHCFCATINFFMVAQSKIK